MSLRLDLESSIERMKNAVKEFAKSIDQLEDVLAAHLDGTVKPRPATQLRPDLKALERDLNVPQQGNRAVDKATGL